MARRPDVADEKILCPHLKGPKNYNEDRILKKNEGKLFPAVHVLSYVAHYLEIGSCGKLLLGIMV